MRDFVLWQGVRNLKKRSLQQVSEHFLNFAQHRQRMKDPFKLPAC